jgi:hypothetical protein
MNRAQSEIHRSTPARSSARIGSLKPNDARMDQVPVTTISGASSIDAIRGTAAEPGSGRPSRDQAVLDNRKRYR